MDNSDPTASILVRLYDGTRELMSPDTKPLITIRDGFQNQLRRASAKGSQIRFQVPYYDNLGDAYTVLASVSGRYDAGFHPVKASRDTEQVLDLMLLPKKGRFDWAAADWRSLKRTNPTLAKILASGAQSDAKAADRYKQLMDGRPESLACMLNITTAMSQIHLPQKTPLDYLDQVIWDDTLAADRFFGYCDRALIDQVKLAAAQGEFSEEKNPGASHPGATLSYKQIEFGEANVQLTFHENDESPRPELVKIEPDIDYFRDIAAHVLLEVIPNAITHSLTDPRQVYLLRWMAGRRAGVPDFNPPYAIVG